MTFHDLDPIFVHSVYWSKNGILLKLKQLESFVSWKLFIGLSVGPWCDEAIRIISIFFLKCNWEKVFLYSGGNLKNFWQPCFLLQNIQFAVREKTVTIEKKSKNEKKKNKHRKRERHGHVQVPDSSCSKVKLHLSSSPAFLIQILFSLWEPITFYSLFLLNWFKPGFCHLDTHIIITLDQVQYNSHLWSFSNHLFRLPLLFLMESLNDQSWLFRLECRWFMWTLCIHFYITCSI